MQNTISRAEVIEWMEKLKTGWLDKKKEDVLKLFEKTKSYYERPFKPATTIEEIAEYWKDIDDVDDCTLDYDIVAIDGNTVCVHWDYKYTIKHKSNHLDGMYVIIFSEQKECIEFRQWWFKEDRGQ